MNLIIPTVSQDPGPDWANNLNASLYAIDYHNHSAGSGVQITPAGINISTDLSFGGNSATFMGSVDFVSSAVAQSQLISAYAVGTDGDLYWNDANGNQIQITASGGVAGSPGSISNLTSPASAAYVAATSTFVWKSTALLNANMDAATLIVRYPGSYPSPAGNYIAIQAPSTLASGYSITLPALPASTSFLTISSTGVLAGGAAVANGITRDNLAPVGQQISSSCGNFSTSSTSFVDITNLSVTITTSGRPVSISIQSDGTSGSGSGGGFDASVNGYVVQILRDATPVSLSFSGPGPGAPLTALLDTPSGGTYTYKVQIKALSGGTAFCAYSKLVAYEL